MLLDYTGVCFCRTNISTTLTNAPSSAVFRECLVSRLAPRLLCGFNAGWMPEWSNIVTSWRRVLFAPRSPHV